MMRLTFEPSKLSRSMTREQWREADRWRRKTEKAIAAALAKRIDEISREALFCLAGQA